VHMHSTKSLVLLAIQPTRYVQYRYRTESVFLLSSLVRIHSKDSEVFLVLLTTV